MEPEIIIRNHIEDRGIKLVFIANKATMSKDTLSKSLSGKRKLKPREFIRVCSVLGLNINDFDEPQSERKQ